MQKESIDTMVIRWYVHFSGSRYKDPLRNLMLRWRYTIRPHVVTSKNMSIWSKESNHVKNSRCSLSITKRVVLLGIAGGRRMTCRIIPRNLTRPWWPLNRYNILMRHAKWSSAASRDGLFRGRIGMSLVPCVLLSHPFKSRDVTLIPGQSYESLESYKQCRSTASYVSFVWLLFTSSPKQY